ncbi:hypothetical protein PCE1_001933 [Barthelona sp. PCE]
MVIKGQKIICGLSFDTDSDSDDDFIPVVKKVETKQTKPVIVRSPPARMVPIPSEPVTVSLKKKPQALKRKASAVSHQKKSDPVVVSIPKPAISEPKQEEITCSGIFSSDGTKRQKTTVLPEQSGSLFDGVRMHVSKSFHNNNYTYKHIRTFLKGCGAKMLKKATRACDIILYSPSDEFADRYKKLTDTHFDNVVDFIQYTHERVDIMNAATTKPTYGVRVKAFGSTSVNQKKLKKVFFKLGMRMVDDVKDADIIMLGQIGSEDRILLERIKGKKGVKDDDFTSFIVGTEENIASNIETLPPIEAVLKGVRRVKRKVEKVVAEKTKVSLAGAGTAIANESASDLWVDKYRPMRAKDLIGNPTSIRNFKLWSLYYEKVRRCIKKGRDFKTSKYYREYLQDAGRLRIESFAADQFLSNFEFDCCLLSGAPGIGKTSSVYMAAKELGFDIVEFNASDVRSKKQIQALFSGGLNAGSVTHILEEGSKTKKSEDTVRSRKRLILMDEVDGMSTGDRGGLQEVLRQAKNSTVPIALIANDMSSSKMRTAAPKVYHLKFRKPGVGIVAKRLKAICARENVVIEDQQLIDLTESANCDIRQCVNTLHMFAKEQKRLRKKHGANTDTSHLLEPAKDLDLGPFDVIPMLFSPMLGGKISRFMQYFWVDYSLMPHFVFECYKNAATDTLDDMEALDALVDASSSIVDGDLIHSTIAMQNWSLLPARGLCGAVYPARIVEGGVHGAGFPSVLGKISSTNKRKRLINEINMSVTQTAHSTPRDVNLNYMSLMRRKFITGISNAITEEAKEVAISELIEFLNAYRLVKHDFEGLNLLQEFEMGKFIPSYEAVDTQLKRRITTQLSSHSSGSNSFKDGDTLILKGKSQLGKRPPKEKTRKTTKKKTTTRKKKSRGLDSFFK